MKEKIKQMLSEESYHIICSFKNISFASYQSLTFLEKIHSAKEVLDYENFMKLLNKQNFCL